MAEYDPHCSSQASTQGLRETQDICSQQFDQSTCENIWGRFFALRRNVKDYSLTEDSYVYTFGRGEVTFQFNEKHFDKVLLPTISKIHFQVHKEREVGSEPVVVLEDKSQNGTFVNKILIGKNKKKVLRNNDEIALARPHCKVFVFYDCLNNDADEYPSSLTEKYTMTKKLGDGTYGEVRLAYAQGSLDRVAVKIVKKKILSANGTTIRFNNISQINNEVGLLRSVNHPCIVKLLDIIDGPERFYIIMELAEGGELFDRISNNGKLKEPIAKIYFYQLVHAVLYLHNKKITHRDIKPENILLDSEDEYARIKLTDFGLSKLTNDASIMTTLCGTPTYIAPELLVPEEGRFYNSKVDMWSVGVVLFVCLAGYAPFNGKNDSDTQRNIRNGKYKMNSSTWNEVSEDAKDLLGNLLVVNPENRFSAEQVLQHNWLKDPEMMEIVQSLIDTPIRNSPPKRPLEMSFQEVVNSKTPKLMSGVEFTLNDR